MAESDFISYVGPPETHDGTILHFEQNKHELVVSVRDYDGSIWEFLFSGVTELSAKDAENMVLYALAEFVNTAPLRRFVFLNWDEESDASLQVVAQNFHFIKVNAIR